MYTRIYSKYLKGRDQCGNSEVGGRMIMKWILGEIKNRRHGVVPSVKMQPIMGCCEHDQLLSDCQILYSSEVVSCLLHISIH
jgi:hypothetical protein